MSLWRSRTRSALLVDLDNIAGQVGGNALMNSVAAWLAWLEDGQFDPRRRKRELVSKIVYWNTPYEHYRASFEGAGFEAKLCASRLEGRSMADMILAADAVATCFGRSSVEEIIILAVDTDYEGLLHALRNNGRRVAITIKPDDPSSEAFPHYANVVFPLDALKQGFKYARQPRKWFSRRAS